MKAIFGFLIGLVAVFAVTAVVSLALPVTYKTAQGQIVKVYKGGVEDAVFELADNGQSFYLNRGYQGYGRAKIESLVGRDVRIVYAWHWTPLDPFGDGFKSIVELKTADAVFVQH